MIAPLFTLLGYDLADPQECVPEFKADFGKSRSVKPVDWAFYQNGRPIFLVEAKDAGTKLGGYDEQLGDYFAKQPDVKLGILTNGVMWRFFTDIIHANVMDKEPFLTWDVLNDDQPPFDFLKLLQKSQFKTELVRTFAQRQHDLNFLVNELDKLLEPSDEFTRLAIANIEKRNLTPDVVESWKPLVARAIGEWAKLRRLADVLNPSPSQNTAKVLRGDTCYATGDRGGDGREEVEASPCRPDRRRNPHAPAQVVPEVQGADVEADLLPDGQVEFQGCTLRHSCSAAAEAARRPPDADEHERLDFWQYRDGAGKRLCLDDARKGSPSQGEATTGSVRRQDDGPERYGLRKKFWEGLLSRPKAKATRHANITPGEFRWIAAGSGVRGLPFQSTSSARKRAGSSCTSTAGRERRGEQGHLRQDSQAQGRDRNGFGGALSWQRLDNKQGCRIAYTTTAGGYRSDESKWPAIQDAMIDAMVRLEQALAPHLAKLKTELRA